MPQNNSATTQSTFYQKIIRPILFTFNPEKIHNHFIFLGNIIGEVAVFQGIINKMYNYKYPENATEIFGKKISSPVMLSAGFDKNAQLVKILPSLGFGGAELGTVTLRPYKGNDGVRLTRVKKASGILVNYGLASIGATKFFENFAKRVRAKDFLWGVSIAPTNDQSQSLNISDLIAEYQDLFPLAQASGADYITLNISCPNTKCGQPFLEPGHLDALLSQLSIIKPSTPTALKLLPDINEKKFLDLLAIATKYPWIKGIICTNLIKEFDRNLLPTKSINNPGGLSGPTILPKMLELLSMGKQKTGNRFTWIACGGISSADDVRSCIKAGASAVQLITAMIYQGPSLIAKINCELAQRAQFGN